MQEYFLEEGKIDIKKLEGDFLPKEDYLKAHQKLIIPCHDVFIKINEGILLVKRNNLPAKGILWPIGGRIKRGLLIEDSLRKKVKEECGLQIEKIEEVGCARTLFQTDPFGHGKGTDTLNVVFFAEGKGKVELDALHCDPTIISKKDYTKEFREILHPYVRDFMDKVIKLI